MVTPRHRRIVVIDLLRTLSILAVLAAHMGTAFLDRDGPGMELFHRVARNGSHGVTVFFVVSGFVITETVLRSVTDVRAMSLRWFYVKRVGRLAPLALLVLAFGAVCVMALEPTSGDGNVFEKPLVSYDGWLAASFPTLTFNWFRIAHEATGGGVGLHWDVFWSLAVEEQFYLLFPLLLRRLGTGRKLVLFLVGVVAFGPAWRWVATVLSADQGLWPVTSSPAAFDQLAIGVLACLASRRFPRRRTWWAPPLALLGAAAVVVTWTGTDFQGGPPSTRIWTQTVVALGTACIIVGGMRVRLLNSLPEAVCVPGRLSYGMYLLHIPVLHILRDLLRGSGPWPAFTTFVMAVVGLAWVSFHRFEQPLNRAIRHRFGVPPTRLPPETVPAPAGAPLPAAQVAARPLP